VSVADTQLALFAASRELDAARAAIKGAGRISVDEQEVMVRRYNAALLGLLQAAVSYTGARMAEHNGDVFAQLLPSGWFEIVDGIPRVKRTEPT
jgi:hypothetical protein